MCVEGYIGYSITNIKDIKHPYAILFIGTAGAALTTEEHFLESVDSILEQAKEKNIYKHFLDIPLMEV